MATSVLQYPFIDAYTTALMTCGAANENSPVFKWLIAGKLPEYPVVTPGPNTKVVEPSAKNRYLANVTVKPCSIAKAVSVAEGSTAIVNFEGATRVTSLGSSVATATVDASTHQITVTGVGEGETILKVYNAKDILIGIVDVSVTEA